MAKVKQMYEIIDEEPTLPKMVIGLLLGILILGIFVMGFEQGQLFSIAQGEQAYSDMWMHEFFHDTRHAAGFPCH